MSEGVHVNSIDQQKLDRSLDICTVSLPCAYECGLVVATDGWKLFHRWCIYTEECASECAFSTRPERRRFFHSTCMRTLFEDVGVFATRPQCWNFFHILGNGVSCSYGFSRGKFSRHFAVILCLPKLAMPLRISVLVALYIRDRQKLGKL